MSSGSSGDIGGEVSGEEAAWRDLIARFDAPGDLSVSAPWPASEDLPTTDSPTATPAGGTPDGSTAGGTPDGSTAGGLSDGSTADGEGANDRDAAARPEAAAEAEPAAERARIIRYAANPRSYSPPEEEDEPYVPTPLPPPARLDGLSKAAWLGLICGPGYLLVGTMLGWTISGTEALIAVAAFVAGFVILVVKMGDRPPRDDNDDGAVL
jgi:hypothetical protein